MSKPNHARKRQAAWWSYFLQFRDGWNYAPGKARHYARMAVDKDLAAVRD
jgi:hypothetical protein